MPGDKFFTRVSTDARTDKGEEDEDEEQQGQRCSRRAVSVRCCANLLLFVCVFCFGCTVGVVYVVRQSEAAPQASRATPLLRPPPPLRPSGTNG